MTDPVNPYAPPRGMSVASSVAMDSVHEWRLDGLRLIARKGAVLPPICLWSGAPTAGMRVRRTLSWAPTWLAILVLSPIVYLVVYLFVRKTADLDFTLGEAARKRQRAAFTICVSGAGVAGALAFAGSRFDLPLLIVAATFLFLATFVTAGVLARMIRPVKIDKEFVTLKLRPLVAQAFARYAAEQGGS